MSIEASIEKLTASVDRNSDLLEKVMGKGAAKAETATAAPKAAAPKAAGKKGAATKAPKAPTVAEVRTAYGEYLNGGDADTRDDRIAEIGEVNKHFGIKALSALDAAQTAEAMIYHAQLVAGEELDFGGAAGGEEPAEDAEGI